MNQAVPAMAVKTALETAYGVKCAYGPYDVSSKLVASMMGESTKMGRHLTFNDASYSISK